MAHTMPLPATRTGDGEMTGRSPPEPPGTPRAYPSPHGGEPASDGLPLTPKQRDQELGRGWPRAGGDVAAAEEHLVDDEVVREELEVTPRLPETVKRGDALAIHLPRPEVHRDRAGSEPGCPFRAAGDDARAGAQMAQHVGERGR